MDRLVTLSRTLYAAAGGLTLLALMAYFVWGSAAATGSSSPVAHAAAPSPPPARAHDGATSSDSLAIGQIVSRNVFSPERTPPRRRYAPPSTAPTPTASGDTLPAGPPPIRLYGVTLSAAGGGVALIEADSKVPGAEVYRIGDKVRSARLVALSESTAVLERPDGDRTVLRLVPRMQRRP